MKNYDEFSEISELSEEDKESIKDWKKWMESNVEEDCQQGLLRKATIIVVCTVIVIILFIGAKIFSMIS